MPEVMMEFAGWQDQTPGPRRYELRSLFQPKFSVPLPCAVTGFATFWVDRVPQNSKSNMVSYRLPTWPSFELHALSSNHFE